MKNWISRSFKNALVRLLVCDGALSSCHRRLDVSVPRRAINVAKHSVLMRTPSPMKHGGENDAVHHRGAHHGAWVALGVLVDAHTRIEICLSCVPAVGSKQPKRTVLCGPSVIPAEEFLVREPHARQVQGLQMPFAIGPRARTHALQRVSAKVQSCQAVFSRQSWRTDGLEAPRLEIFV